MIPRGEVGLIFAQLGLDREVFDQGQFSAVTLMVIVTTFIAPPWLKALLSARSDKPDETQGLDELVVGPREMED
jgi:hypothetical protein